MRTSQKMIGCAMVLLAACSVATVAAGPNKVTSSLDWPVWGGWYCTGEGTVTGTFVAIPGTEGSWDVAAKFRPRGVNLECWSGMPGCCPWHQRLRGVGVAEFNAVPGVPVTITADGLYWDSGPVEYPANFTVTVIVGADGVVSLPFAAAFGSEASDPVADEALLDATETDTDAEEYVDFEGSTELGVASHQAGACEAGSYVGSTPYGGGYTSGEAKKQTKVNAQAECAAHCGALDACPSNKPTCQGSAHVGGLSCWIYGAADPGVIWICSGDYTCTCACAGNR